MTDAWSDMKRRSIMNLCVNSRGGTCFLSSKDTSKDSHTGEFIFNYIDQCIEDIGADKIVQVVTDNATNNVAAAKMLKQKRPRIFWTGCAAHTVDLMLEGISKLSGFARIIDQAKAVTIFIYAHHKTLSMMRAYAKRDIVRPGATRFATCFLTLHSLYEKKAHLKNMFGSDEWHDCKHSKCVKGKNASDIVMSYSFWNSVMVILKVFSPLVKVLRLADGEKVPSLGFIFGEILEAKKSIKEAFDHLEKNYLPVFRIIDEKMKGNWWATYGCGAPTLQRLATRILALTSSSSGCERNWSSFEGIHTKRRNRLGVNRLNSLVYVHFNARLLNKQKKIREKNADVIFDDGNEDTVEDWLVERVEEPDSDVNFLIGIQAPRVRDLYDDDFESEEEEDIVDMEFEPDVFQDILLFPEAQVAS
ncbi:uncharacterized protein LOC103868883 isoform X2 [Brassica rapa]|uniref:uncharacterized protein LOC103868883 isoform X2 n=1 Tax=Brassica campestris TaxID=3711 RepID=UPI00142D45C7|nr:uncharacterized protein LOC103868883 isoform X2 [Brassica rapa]